MAGFAARLAEAAPGFASAVVPVAEIVARAPFSNRTPSLSFGAPGSRGGVGRDHSSTSLVRVVRFQRFPALAFAAGAL
jgi:hypothetical protein